MGSRHNSLVFAECRLSFSRACGIFLDQGWNPCPLNWQADSYPLYTAREILLLLLMLLLGFFFFFSVAQIWFRGERSEVSTSTLVTRQQTQPWYFSLLGYSFFFLLFFFCAFGLPPSCCSGLSRFSWSSLGSGREGGGRGKGGWWVLGGMGNQKNLKRRNLGNFPSDKSREIPNISKQQRDQRSMM